MNHKQHLSIVVVAIAAALSTIYSIAAQAQTDRKAGEIAREAQIARAQSQVELNAYARYLMAVDGMNREDAIKAARSYEQAEMMARASRERMASNSRVDPATTLQR